MCWPGAHVKALSQFDTRDAQWFGIGFLPQSPYSLNPIDYLRLLREARQADVVLWGGGELLKDDTTRLGLVYWALKATGLRFANRQLFGAYQGIGPTEARSSRRMVVYSVDRTQDFLVRDAESAKKLRDWGARVPITASFDPAIVAPIEPWSDELASRAQSALGVRSNFLDDVVGISVRRWFHYRRGGWLPFRLRKKTDETPAFLQYRQHVVELVDRITEDFDSNVMFIPMHMASSEGDDLFARDILSRMRHPERARVLDDDTLVAGRVDRCDPALPILRELTASLCDPRRVGWSSRDGAVLRSQRTIVLRPTQPARARAPDRGDAQEKCCRRGVAARHANA